MMMIEKIKSKFLKNEFVCYFCNDKLHQFTEIKLFDNRIIPSCFECFKTNQEGLEIYREKTEGVAAL